MKNSFYKKLLTIILIQLYSVLSFGQTNVSGGIYADTTWTKANSPYIVIDTVVVFPGVTLTIEPGVIVKFYDNKMLTVRQGNILAEGTLQDSITFTSNSSNPHLGIWAGITLNNAILEKFNYCNFFYADQAFFKQPGGFGDSLFIKNSNFSFNNRGLHYGYLTFLDSCNFTNNTSAGNWQIFGSINNCNYTNNGLGLFASQVNVTNCNFHSNQTGIRVEELSTIKNCIIDSNAIEGIELYWGGNLVEDCIIKYNGIGVYVTATPTYGANTITKNIIDSNAIGIKVDHWQDTIFCNRICNNTTHGFYNNISNNGTEVANNYWCASDSVSVASMVYDGYDNVNLGLVSFMPIDTLSCYTLTEIIEKENMVISLFPNPVGDYLFIVDNSDMHINSIRIYDIRGIQKFTSSIHTSEYKINVSDLAKGIYIIEISEADKTIRKKFVKE